MPVNTKIHSGGLADNAVSTDKIADDAVVATKIDDDGTGFTVGNFTNSGTLQQTGQVTLGSGGTNWTLPTARGTTGYVLTRDDSVGTGGTTWKETITAPAITNVTGEINEDTNTTLTVTGSGFESGMTIKLINSSTGADIAGHTALSYSGTSSPLTVTIPSATTNITAGTSVKLHINKQGLTTTSGQSFVVSEDPNWTTTSGTFATISDRLVSSSTVGTLSASAGAGGGTIVYASDDSSLDATYFSLASNGVITTTSTALTGLTGSGNYTEAFNANAKVQGEESTKNTLLSGINIIINKTPVGSGITPTIIDIGGVDHLVYQFTSTGTSTFTVYNALSNVEYLVIAGGGEGGSYGTTNNYHTGSDGNPSFIRVQGAGSTYLVHCTGGGGGGAYGDAHGRNGGSGGGGPGGTSYNNAGTGASNEGYAGGIGRSQQNPYLGGGGGGAASVGQPADTGSGRNMGAGGIGLTSSITGTSVGRAGGGGGGGWDDNSAVWAPGGAWNGSARTGATGGAGDSNQAFGAGNGGSDNAGGSGGANTGAGGGAGDTGVGAGHAGGGAGGYRSSVTGESTGGGGTLESKLSMSAQTYEISVGAGGSTYSHGGDGGSGVVIIRFAL